MRAVLPPRFDFQLVTFDPAVEHHFKRVLAGKTDRLPFLFAMRACPAESGRTEKDGNPYLSNLYERYRMSLAQGRSFMMKRIIGGTLTAGFCLAQAAAGLAADRPCPAVARCESTPGSEFIGQAAEAIEKHIEAEAVTRAALLAQVRAIPDDPEVKRQKLAANLALLRRGGGHFQRARDAIGAAWLILGQRDNDSALLEKALAAYRENLQEKSHERTSKAWAMTQYNTGLVLSALGARENDPARLEEAVEAYREALKVYTRERMPAYWALTHDQLGNALLKLGQSESGTVRLEEAAQSCRNALSIPGARAAAIAPRARRNLALAEELIGTRRARASAATPDVN
jgi:tetratricopeptide (TPR) repeat protein